MATKFSDVSSSSAWAAGDSLQGITSSNAELRLLIESIIGTSADRTPTKMHPGSNGIDSTGPIVVNPAGLTSGIPSGGDDLAVAGSGNRGAALLTTSTSGAVVTLYLGSQASPSAVQLQWNQDSNHVTFLRGDGRIRLDDDGLRIYNKAAGAYGSLITRFNDWAAFTPTLYGTTSGTGVAPTYATNGQWGEYRVWNDEVEFNAHIELSAIGSVAGSIRLGGLPIDAASNTPGADYPVSVGRVNECSNGADLRAAVGQGQAYIELFRNQNSSGANAANIVESNLGADFMIRVSGSYPI